MDMTKELASLASNLLGSADIDEIIFMQEVALDGMKREFEELGGTNGYFIYHQSRLLDFLTELKKLVKLDPMYKAMRWTNKFRAFKYSLDVAQNSPHPDENEIAKCTNRIIELFNDPLADHSLFPFPRISD